jgi:tyrosyl-tRNA synthetase
VQLLQPVEQDRLAGFTAQVTFDQLSCPFLEGEITVVAGSDPAEIHCGARIPVAASEALVDVGIFPDGT